MNDQARQEDRQEQQQERHEAAVATAASGPRAPTTGAVDVEVSEADAVIRAAAAPELQPHRTASALVPATESAGAATGGLRGRAVIVTGGATDLGADIVRAFAAEGSIVGILDRDEEAGQWLAATIANVHFQGCDPTNVAELLAALTTLIARLGGVDALVVVTAASRGGQSVEALTPDDFDAAVGLQLRTHCFASQAVIGPMRERGGGAIVAVLSVRAPHDDTARALDAACRAALDGFTRGLAVEVGADGIRVNEVLTSPFVGASEAADDAADDEADAARAQRSRLPGALTAADVVHMVLFLAGDAARMVTAQRFVVDAGLSSDR